jgi:hypothetical protein
MKDEQQNREGVREHGEGRVVGVWLVGGMVGGRNT